MPKKNSLYFVLELFGRVQLKKAGLGSPKMVLLFYRHCLLKFDQGNYYKVTKYLPAHHRDKNQMHFETDLDLLTSCH